LHIDMRLFIVGNVTSEGCDGFSHQKVNLTKWTLTTALYTQIEAAITRGADYSH